MHGRNKRDQVLLWVGVLLICGGAIKGVISALEPGDPLKDQPCQGCHIAADGGADPFESQMLLMGQEQLCLSCHPDALKASHPSGVRPPPDMQVPEIFPIDWKGDLTCSSCHYIHKGGHGRMRSDLRGKEYCLACHEDSFFLSMVDGGESIMLAGHLKEIDSDPLLGIDPFSIQCIECHDNSGEARNLQVAFADGLVRHNSGTNHPIGVKYADSAMSRPGDYKQMAMVPKEVMLPDGMVGCVSCHEGYTKLHGKLIPQAT